MASRAASLTLVLGSVLALSIGSACGSIPDSRKILPEGYGEDDGGGSGGRGTGGAGSGGETDGGSSGGRGSGGDEGDAGPDGGGGVPARDGGLGTGGTSGRTCGSTLCSDIAIGAVNLPACCTGTGNRRCGVDFAALLEDGGCVEVNAPGALNSACPTRANGDGEFPGCCRNDTNSCGIVYKAGPVNFGCIDPLIQEFPAGGACTPAQCLADGAICETSADCCDVSEQGSVCSNLDGTSRCARYCTENADCASGCCIALVSGFGACSQNAADCSADCRVLGEACDADGDCCTGAVCAANGSRGPKTCHEPCTTNAACAPEFCYPDPVSGHSYCTDTGQGLCTNTCIYANDDVCDDGGPGADYTDCALGTDCADCAAVTDLPARPDGASLCSETCETANDGECDDGGPSSVSFNCSLGTDCRDCGRRLGICSDDCRLARNGVCNDGGENAADAGCSTGTDCSDCGTRFAGRGQGICDGTQGTLCNMNGEAWRPGVSSNGICSCTDCAWEAADCSTPDKCDGQTLGECCTQADGCGYGDDGYCDCRGWCSWEAADCGISTPVTPPGPAAAP